MCQCNKCFLLRMIIFKKFGWVSSLFFVGENMKDCRTLEFKKWILPKTESIYSVNDSNLTIGYFDFIAVKKIEGDQDNPLEIYIKQKENSKKELFISSSYDDYKNKNDNRNFI